MVAATVTGAPLAAAELVVGGSEAGGAWAWDASAGGVAPPGPSFTADKVWVKSPPEPPSDAVDAFAGGGALAALSWAMNGAEDMSGGRP